ncbi:MAG TPA: AI-2E family transporter [Thermoanaerobaculia bacterium]|jgi:predicted PurR-regulated permease PerM|nr:AI-2E family transporter [Thermoanaerobaculia bacterium]
MLQPIRPDAPEEERPRPDIKKLRDVLQGPFGIKSLALTGLFILAGFYTLYFGREFFLPLILALLLSFLLSPIVRFFKKLHVPEALGAAVVVLSLLAVLGVGIYELSGQAYTWMQQAPASLSKIERRLRELKKPVQTVSKATEQVAKVAQVGGGDQRAPVTASAAPSLGERLASGAFAFVASGVTMLILLYFLLAAGDLFLRKLIKVLPSLADKKRAVEIAREIETEISTYLSTVTFINVVLGLAVWGAMALIGVPNPLLWGVMATFTNYVPYLGAMTMYVVLAGVGFLTFSDLPHSLMPPGAFLVLNVLEAYLLTPMILGRRLTLNPVVIFLALSFWGWLWGITGAVLAVPIMVVFKIFCDHSEPLAPIGEFLGT